MLREDLEEIERYALELLLKESADEQRRLLGEADHELLSTWGIDAHIHVDRGPHQGVHDVVYAPGLKDILSLFSVTPEHVLGAEDFRDLLDRLIPANPDR
jgi:hypothetical protein